MNGSDWNIHGVASAYVINHVSAKSGEKNTYAIHISGFIQREADSIALPAGWTNITDSQIEPIPPGYRPNSAAGYTKKPGAMELVFPVPNNGNLPAGDGIANWFRIDGNGNIFYRPLFDGAPGSGAVSATFVYPLSFRYFSKQDDVEGSTP